MENVTFAKFSTYLFPRKSFFIISQGVIDRFRINSAPHVVVNDSCKKDLEMYSSIINVMIDEGVTRDYTIVCIGGGFITDLGGFIASTYMRGIKGLIFVPTTLLCAIDASHGGKNGVDFFPYKNMIGCFREPDRVIIDIPFLRSSPDEVWEEGLAEIIKLGYIYRKTLLTPEKISDESLIRFSIEGKRYFVNEDFVDQKGRQFLNFGHTFGHALEHLYNFSHSEAVLHGMKFALTFSESYYNVSWKDEISRINSYLKTKLPENFDLEEMVSRMSKDKKNSQGKIGLIILKTFGVPILCHFTQEEILKHLKDFDINHELKAKRNEIEMVDNQIFQLLTTRFSLCREIGKLKGSVSLVADPKRECELIEKYVMRWNFLGEDFIRNFMINLFAESKKIQKNEIERI